MPGGAGIGNSGVAAVPGLVMNDFINFQIGTYPPTYEGGSLAETKF